VNSATRGLPGIPSAVSPSAASGVGLASLANVRARRVGPEVGFGGCKDAAARPFLFARAAGIGLQPRPIDAGVAARRAQSVGSWRRVYH